MKNISKGKRIALIVIAVILSLVILVPLGLFVFFFRINPLFLNGEEIKAAFEDKPVMYVACQNYDKQNITYSGEKNIFSEKGFEIVLPKEFEANTEKEKDDGIYAYTVKDGEETLCSVLISVPFNMTEDGESSENEELTQLEKFLYFSEKIIYGPAAKKVYGVKLGTQYGREFLINSISLDNFDTENQNQVFLISMYGIQKSVSGIGDFTNSKEIYKVETDTYRGFIYNRSKVAEKEDEKPYKLYVLNAYAPDNLNFPYTVSIIVRNAFLEDDDIFAILNSFKVK